MTPKQELILCAAMHPNDWGWRIQPGEAPQHAAVVLGPMDPNTDALTRQAVYTWDPTRAAYTGPSGGLDQEYFRIPLTQSPGDELAQIQAFAVRKGWRNKEAGVP